MRHRSPRHLPAFLRLHRARPRRRLATLAGRWHPSGWLPSRPSTRLASALGAMLLLLSGGALAVGALGDDTVPAADNAAPDRSLVPSTSRSIDRTTLSPAPDDGTPDQVTTPQGATTPEERTAPDTTSPAAGTPTPDPSSPPGDTTLPVRAPTDATRSVPTPATPDLPTPSSPDSSGRGPGTPAARTVDHAAPGTALDSMPDQRDDSATADFSFHANEDASFTCSLDGGAFRPCGSGVAYAVQPGWHDFAVRATDRAGNVDASPARWHWHTSARD